MAASAVRSIASAVSSRRRPARSAIALRAALEQGVDSARSSAAMRRLTVV